ncbi:MAG: hypothetical protein ACOCTH_02755 [Halodesulfurarchaeum sp.]
MDQDTDGPTASAILDRFTRVDNLLEETNEGLGELLDAVESLEDITSATDDLTQAIGQLSESVGADTEFGGVREFPYPLSAEIPENTGSADDFYTEFDAPHEARVSRVIVEAHEATQQGVGVRVGTSSGDVWLPRGGETSAESDGKEEPYFLAAPSEPVVFRPNVLVEEGEPIRCQYGNNDTENPHYATVVPILREV